jgi:hypothetical protein
MERVWRTAMVKGVYGTFAWGKNVRKKEVLE